MSTETSVAGRRQPVLLGWPAVVLAALLTVTVCAIGGAAFVPGDRDRGAPAGAAGAQWSAGLHASYSAAGIAIEAGGARLEMRAARFGYGSDLTKLAAVSPRYGKNRVTYARGPLGEWYANRASGIEQGFTIPRAPARTEDGPLTIALELQGLLRASPAPGGVSFSRGGKTVLSYGGLSAVDSSGRHLPAWLALHNGELFVRVNVRGARFPVSIDPYFERKLFNEAGERLGPTVAITPDGNTAFIDDSLYERVGGEWVPQHKVGKEEGGTVALSADGNTLASAFGRDPENEDGYVLKRSGGVWEAEGQELVPKGVKPEFGSRFGASIGVSENGDTILFGAPYDRGSGFEEIGGVWVFVRVGETWTQQTILEGEPGETQCGEDVALSADGDTALVKCTHAVKVYVREGETWRQQGPALPGGGFLALTPNGDTAFVTNSPEGSIYQRSGESWTLTGKLHTLQPGAEEEEIAVAADEEQLLIDEGGAGVVLYQGSGASWTPTEGLSPLGVSGSTRNGRDFATSSNAAIILMGEGANGSWEFTPGEPIRGPEVGRCVAHPKNAGTFHDSGCTKQSRRGSPYEWEPGALKGAFTLSGGAVKLEPAAQSKITCSGLSGSGAFSGRKTLGGVHVSLAGCAQAGQQCTSPMAGAGQINTEELQGALGVESEGVKTKIGIGLSPVSGAVAEFTCGTTSVSIRGGVIASVKSGKPESSSALKYAASKGAQKPSHFVGGPEQQLEVSFGGGPYEPIRLVAKATQTYEETLVLNPLD